MSDDFDELACAAADALITAMVTDSWKAIKQRFAALVGHERRMDATRAALIAVSGPERYKAQLAQARIWSTRVRDTLDDHPGAAEGLRTLIAELAITPSDVPAFQRAHASHGSQVVNVGGNISGNSGEVYVGVGTVDKRKVNIALAPFLFLIHVTKKLITAHPAAAIGSATVVVVAAAGAGGWSAHWPAAVFGAATPNAGIRATAKTLPAPLPPVMVYALGNHKVTPVQANTRLVGRGLPIVNYSTAFWQLPGSSQVAAVQTARGLTAYVLSYGSHVVPVDVATDTAGTPIPLGFPSGGEALAADPDGRIVYVIVTQGNSKRGMVVPVDTATDTAGKVINVGVQPDAIAFSPNGKLAYVANVDDDTVTPIDVVTGAAGKPIPAPQGPNDIDIVFTPDGRTAYIAGPEVTAIDVATGTVAVTIPVSAAHLAMTPDGRTLFALGSNSVTPISTVTNTAGTPIPVIGGEILVAPDGKTVYVLDQQGNLTPIDVATGAVGAKATDPGGYASDMAITPDGKTIWISDESDSEIDPFDTVTGTMGRPVKIADGPSFVVIVP